MNAFPYAPGTAAAVAKHELTTGLRDTEWIMLFDTGGIESPIRREGPLAEIVGVVQV